MKTTEMSLSIHLTCKHSEPGDRQARRELLVGALLRAHSGAQSGAASRVTERHS